MATMVSADERNGFADAWEVRGFDPDSIRAADLFSYFYSRDARNVAKRLIAKWKPEIVHLHIYYGQLTPSIIGVFQSEGIPVVQTLHEYKLICPVATMVRDGQLCELCCTGSYWNAAVHRCNRKSIARSLVTSIEAYTSRWLGGPNEIDHFIAVSDFVRATMIRFGVKEDSISTIHNFIDTNWFQATSEPGDYFVYFGRLEQIKGVRTLIEAMKGLPAKLVVAGEGEFLAQLRKDVAHHSVNVEFVGFQKGAALHDLIRGSRCVVVPSEWNETFGLVILEANALGKPVVASRIGGMPEVVRHGETGMLFEAGNVAELRLALEWMWKNPAAAMDMGAHARKWVETAFGKEAHYARIMRLYNEVVQGPAANGSVS